MNAVTAAATGAVIVLMIMSGCPNHVAANVSKIAGSMAISKGKKPGLKKPGLKKAGSKTAAKKGAGAKSAAKMDRAGGWLEKEQPKSVNEALKKLGGAVVKSFVKLGRGEWEEAA